MQTGTACPPRSGLDRGTRLAWVAYLLFCYRLVIRTSDSASLKHAAVAARAFGSAAPAAIAQAVTRLLAHARR